MISCVLLMRSDGLNSIRWKMRSSSFLSTAGFILVGNWGMIFGIFFSDMSLISSLEKGKVPAER